MRPSCIFIAGPTGVGKTEIAFQIANYFKTEIISFDSRQCFKELNIGVAKPIKNILNAIPHHFINSHSVYEPMSVVIFKQYAEKKIESILNRNNIVVLVGGTGFYMNALLYGIDDIPATPVEVREAINNQINQHGMSWLNTELIKYDRNFFTDNTSHNPRHLQRALEIFITTGKSISSFKTLTQKTTNYNYKIIGINIDRQMLYSHLNQRIDAMMQQGLEQEVKRLYLNNAPIKDTIGYKEFEPYLKNEISLNIVIENIKKNTRNYAKRQWTWFNRNKEIFWCHNTELDKILSYIHKT